MGNDSATARASKAKASVREAIRKLTDDQLPELGAKPAPQRKAAIELAQESCKQRETLKH